MTFKIILPIAFAAFALSPAMAQDYTFRGETVPAEQVQTLIDHCAALLDEVDGEAEAATAADPTNSESTAAVDFATLDIATVTRSDCVDGGFTPDDGSDNEGGTGEDSSSSN